MLTSVPQRLVHETIIAHRKDFLTAFQYCSNLVQDVESAFGDVEVKSTTGSAAQ